MTDKIKYEIEGYQCARCTWLWKPRGDKPPMVCPKCKSPWWQTPRKGKVNDK